MTRARINHRRLRRLRRASGVSIARIFLTTGICQTSIAHYETGRVVPPLDKLYALAKLYGVTMDSLMEAEE